MKNPLKVVKQKIDETKTKMLKNAMEKNPDTFKYFILTEFKSKIKKKYPQFKNDDIITVTFMGKTKPDGTKFGQMRQTAVGKPDSKFEIDYEGIKELLKIAPTLKEKEVDEIVLEFNFHLKTISGQLKKFGSETFEKFNY